MLRFLLDTDHLTLYQRGHKLLEQRIALQAPGEVGLSAITVEEALRGRLVILAQARDGSSRIRRYAELVETVRLLQQFDVVTFDQDSEGAFQQLHGLRHRVGTQDRKIAAVALAHKLVLLTRNRRDFSQVPGLLIEDWSI
jgi:tRNA(fMet)-specific endonuclease VapC